jgi:pSer/pThr/pTyr-binding forkhead associated (FHA) protein
MAKLVLKYEASVLKEIPLKKPSISIGRAPGNDVVIDNLAVSGHHAKLLVESGRFLVEDLNSLNGTFLNNQRIRRSPLKDGDEILIGKHTLQFFDEGAEGVALFAGPGWEKDQRPLTAEQTVVLDTKKRREFLAKATSIATEGASSEAAEKVACLVVLRGRTNQREYILTSRISVIGKDPGAFVRLRGWFLPKVAAIITRRGTHFDIAPSEKAGSTRINSEPLTAARELNEGDLVEVGRTQLRFYFRE